MILSFLFSPKKGHKFLQRTENDREEFSPNAYEANVADGIEFLDDGFRMIDQPFEKNYEDDYLKVNKDLPQPF